MQEQEGSSEPTLIVNYHVLKDGGSLGNELKPGSYKKLRAAQVALLFCAENGL